MPRDEWKAKIAVEYISHFMGLPYVWAGDDSIAGFDCSGLVVEYLKSFGAIAGNADYTADQLYRMFEDKKVSSGRIGAMVFFGKTKAWHVGICINSLLMIEAGGGGKKTKSRKDAIKQNAFVRIRPINRRPNILGYFDPFLQE